ncbi:MAG: hypothetical protein LBM59_05305 [Ruminococcus sp.]|jgi:hypothetical protein|nr:hypothetical protein [Ruminococcus sp.]
MTETTEQAFENADTEGLEDLFNNIDLDKILELINLLSNPPSDKNVNFLLALKPLLSEDRAPKVEKAVKILKMYDIYQTLKESGMLSGLSDLI